jgi:hypothetical protein
MGVGKKATGQETLGKMLVSRHGDMCKRSANALEKVYETRVRRQGKRECNEGAKALER